MFKLVYLTVLAATISFISTPLVRKLAYKVGAIDVPEDERRVHKTPIPRLGGLAIFIGFMLSFIIYCRINYITIDKGIIGVLLGGTIIIAVGVIDDTKSLSAKYKLLGQIVAACILIAAGIRVEYMTNFFRIESIPFLSGEQIHFGIIAIPITIFWVVGITNTVNLIDGLDGLACGISAIAAGILAYVAYIKPELPDSQLTLIFALGIVGSCIGFLPYNFNPAKIFMGDTGSLFLGFMLSAISINGFIKGPTILAVLVPLFALGLPIFDTAFAILRRKIQGKPVMEADKGHLHHRLLSLGLGQKRTVLVLYIISLLLGVSIAMMLNQDYLNSAVTLIITATIVAVPINQTWMGEVKAKSKEK